ncbi:MAG TPA: preprotein translocase subunit SecA [Clostridiales bacterium]|nr:preprotein translocase subunit SecA [Clostridiales bacterium]
MSQMVQRGLNFAIVDEVDSILIDEARTPLIISGRGQKSSTLYFDANRFVKTLIPDEDYTVDIKEKNVQITDQGSRKAEKFFHVDNIADVTNAELNHHIQQALKAHTLFKKDEDYIVSDGEIIIVDEFTGRLMIGRRYSEGLHQAIEAKENVTIRNENQTYATITFQNYFRLYTKLSGMTGTAKTEEEEFKTIYGLDVLEIPTNKPMQRKDMPDMVFSTEKGKMQAIVNEIVKVHETGQPVLVGTVTVERSEEISKQLLRNRIRHNILNAKNHQREAEIIAQAGKKGAVTIATNMAGRGTDILLGGNPEYLAKQDLRNKGIAEEDIDMASSFVQDVSDEIKALREEYNKLLEEHKKVTDAEKEEVIKAGGLYILGTERHESRRIDNQLRGRAGRQGDPGKSQFFISLEDDLARRFGGERMKRLYSMFKIDEYTPIQSKMLSRSIENAQRTIEGQNFGIRRNVIQYDDVMNTQRMVIYEERMKVLRGENVHENILKLIPDYVERVVKECVDYSQNLTKWDYEKLNRVLQDKVLPLGIEFLDEDKCAKWDYEYFMKKLLDKTIDEYEKKITRYREEENIDYYAIERDVLLTNVDKKWIDHIDNMDRLKRGISLRSFANEDPINPFKREGLEMFEEMVESIQTDTVFLLLKMELRKEPVRKSAPTNLQASNGGNVTVRKNAVKEIGRNDPCPCGSGKKYKNCCGRK